MSDKPKRILVQAPVEPGYFQRTEVLRWLVPEGSTTERPILQQAHFNATTGETRWETVQIVVVDSATFALASATKADVGGETAANSSQCRTSEPGVKNALGRSSALTVRPQETPMATDKAVREKPLFIPLRGEWYDKIERGEKASEYRAYGPRWNERTCRVGRRAVLSRGYGTAHRMQKTVSSFVRLDWVDAPPEARAIYPDATFIAEIGLRDTHG